MNKPALIVGAIGAFAMLYAWKGKEIRSQLTLTGEGWNRLHPEVQRRALKVIEEANREFADDGLAVGIFEGYRSRERQQEVMDSGNSWTKDSDSSYHRWGLAVDIVFLNRLGRWTWSPPRAAWDRLGAIIERHGFQWGGRFRTFDGAHAQLPLMTIAQLKSQYTTPERYFA